MFNFFCFWKKFYICKHAIAISENEILFTLDCAHHPNGKIPALSQNLHSLIFIDTYPNNFGNNLNFKG